MEDIVKSPVVAALILALGIIIGAYMIMSAGRFVPLQSGLVALDTKTGTMCVTVGEGTDQMPRCGES